MKERLHFDLERIRKLKEDVQKGIKYPAEMDRKAVVTATGVAVAIVAGVTLTMLYKSHYTGEEVSHDSDWPATDYEKLPQEE